MADHIRLATSDKTIAVLNPWRFEDASERRLIIKLPLDIDGVTEEGLALEVIALANDPDREVNMVLKHVPATVLPGPLLRINWNPIHEHDNKNRGHRNWKWQKICQSHIHPFDENYALGWKIMVRENCPIAHPIDRPLPTFRTALQYAGDMMRIIDIQRVPMPPYCGRLV